MKEQALIQSLTRIEPSDAQRKKMLNHIYDQMSKKNTTMINRLKIVIPAFSCALLILLSIIPSFIHQPIVFPIDALQDNPAPFARIAAPLALSPKYFNYQGNRYEFMTDGAKYDLSKVKLTEMLGSLEHSITFDVKRREFINSDLDYASTYMTGGTLYKVSAYDIGFRLAVVKDNSYYLAQIAGKVDKSPLPAAIFFKNGNLRKITAQIRIMNRAGTVLLYESSSQKLIKTFIDNFSEASPADNLTDEQYQTFRTAQSNGRSYKVQLKLKDSTDIIIYITPDIGILSIGENNYFLTESFLSEYSAFFEKLNTSNN